MQEKLEIYYVRHGCADNGKAEDRDRCDINLDELGEKQIALLAERFADKEFDAVFASPLVRAVKTGSAVCKMLKNNPVMELMPNLVECGTSEGYFGQSAEYLSRYYGNLKLNTDLLPVPKDNGERAKAVIDYFKSRFNGGGKILAFSHGTFGTDFISQAVGIPKGDYIFSLNHTSVTKIKYTPDGKQRISFCNDFSHLHPIMPDYEFTV